MGLKTSQIVKILQLKGLGRKSAVKICDKAMNEVLDTDSDLQEFVLGCIANNWVSRLPVYSKYEFEEAFHKGDEICEKSENADVRIISIYDSDFPNKLKIIPDNPILLSFKGDFKQLNTLTGIAIIGTREPTLEGIKSGEYFGEMLGKEGFNVVSGLAIGCDSAAHRGCLKSNGFTTAIVAHGLHTIYPKENQKLADEIVAKGGVLLSEYLFGVGALANYFVERDRLQAGLSSGTIVIQTGVKGGTMHAVNATLDTGKVLAAVKYKTDIYSEKVRGNEMLINNKKAFALTSNNLVDFMSLLTGNNVQLNKKVNVEQNCMAKVDESKPDTTKPPKQVIPRKKSHGKKDKGLGNAKINF